MNAVCVIPSAGKVPTLMRPLMNSLSIACVPTYVNVDPEVAMNVDVDARGWPNKDLVIHKVPGRSIHVAWNCGLGWAENQHADWCFIMNDDAYVAPGDWARLITAVDPIESIWVAGFDYDHHPHTKIRYVKGTLRDGGVGGFAFAVRLGHGLRFDEGFRWWGGDDDFIWTVNRAGGRSVVVEGVPVDHPAGGNSSGRHFDMSEALASDRTRLLAKWGSAW